MEVGGGSGWLCVHITNWASQCCSKSSWHQMDLSMLESPPAANGNSVITVSLSSRSRNSMWSRQDSLKLGTLDNGPNQNKQDFRKASIRTESSRMLSYRKRLKNTTVVCNPRLSIKAKVKLKSSN